MTAVKLITITEGPPCSTYPFAPAGLATGAGSARAGRRAAPGRPPRGDADDDRLKKTVTTAVAMGLSTRQIEEFLAILLPADEVPDHATAGR